MLEAMLIGVAPVVIGICVGSWASRGFPLTWLRAIAERKWPDAN